VSGQPYASVALPPKRKPKYTLNRGLGGPHSRSGRFGEEKNPLPLSGIEFCNVRVILRRTLEIVAAVKKQKYLNFLSVCSLSYPAYKAHAPYYIGFCGLAGSTEFYRIIS
jgi:hypothetical protein